MRERDSEIKINDKVELLKGNKKFMNCFQVESQNCE